MLRLSHIWPIEIPSSVLQASVFFWDTFFHCVTVRRSAALHKFPPQTWNSFTQRTSSSFHWWMVFNWWMVNTIPGRKCVGSWSTCCTRKCKSIFLRRGQTFRRKETPLEGSAPVSTCVLSCFYLRACLPGVTPKHSTLAGARDLDHHPSLKHSCLRDGMGLSWHSFQEATRAMALGTPE